MRSTDWGRRRQEIRRQAETYILCAKPAGGVVIGTADLLVASIAAFLKHTGAAPGQVKVGSGGSVNRADWIDWTAPTLLP